jgi:hypothetical protein
MHLTSDNKFKKLVVIGDRVLIRLRNRMKEQRRVVPSTRGAGKGKGTAGLYYQDRAGICHTLCL